MICKTGVGGQGSGVRGQGSVDLGADYRSQLSALGFQLLAFSFRLAALRWGRFAGRVQEGLGRLFGNSLAAPQHSDCFPISAPAVSEHPTSQETAQYGMKGSVSI
jgi:hypothetical protein